MTESLRDRLAAVLGPGNDDQAAYAQADAVLDILVDEFRFMRIQPTWFASVKDGDLTVVTTFVHKTGVQEADE